MVDTAPLAVGANGTVDIISADLETIGAPDDRKGGRLRIGGPGGAANLAGDPRMRGSRIEMPDPSSLGINGAVDRMRRSPRRRPRIRADRRRPPRTGRRALDPRGQRARRFGREHHGNHAWAAPGQGVAKTGDGTLTFSGNNNTYGGATTVHRGPLEHQWQAGPECGRRHGRRSRWQRGRRGGQPAGGGKGVAGRSRWPPVDQVDHLRGRLVPFALLKDRAVNTVSLR